MRNALVLLCLVVGAAAAAQAQDRPAVIVTPGETSTFKAAVQDFRDTSPQPKPGRPAKFRAFIEEGLAFSGAVEALPHAAFLGPEQSATLDGGPPVQCGDWSQVGADALVQGAISVGTELVVEYRIWDVTRCKRLARKRYRQPATADPAVMGRRIADDIVAAFVGVRGVSATEIAFISTRRGNSEVFVANVIGSNARAATANGSINAFPSWTPSGDGIVYTSYRHQDTPRLFLSSRGRGRPGRLLRSLRGGYAEYRGVFAPDGKSLAVVMSAPGAASDIYRVKLDSTKATALSRNRAIEIAPSWSPDGRQIAFVSDRTGNPQVYVMNADGSNQRRLTFQGNYNTHPAWSPDGRWIAYETRMPGGNFDIWITDPEGSVVYPLVQHPRSDESPSWAPNSRKLAFSSRRRGRADIYVIDLNGENLRRITEAAGENTSPSWGPYSR